MSESLQAVILGIVEGLTEFLPVSSTGHMIITMPLIGVDPKAAPWPAFLYFVQIGAILAVILYFRRQLWRQAVTLADGRLRSHIFFKVFVAMLPGAVVGLTLDDFMEEHLETPIPVAAALGVGAAVMVAVERRSRRGGPMRIEDVTMKQAVFVGFAQCVSIVPGTSRAMATIMGGMAVGLPPAVAAEFSFYLAIPTLCGAGALRIFKHWADITPGTAIPLTIGFAVSLLVALLVVGAFMRYIRARPLWPFAIYRVTLGLAVLAWFWGRP